MLVTVLVVTIILLSIAVGFLLFFLRKTRPRQLSTLSAALHKRDPTALESRLLEDIFNTFPDAMIFRNMSGRAVFFNEALLHAWGQMARDEFIAAPMEKWLRYPNSDAFILPNTSPMARALKGETVISEELVVCYPGSSERQILVTSIPVYHEDVQYGVFSVSRDVRNLTRDFEYRSQRSRLDALGTLAGGIAHDFNNQLATIMGSAQIALTEQDQSGRVPEYLETIIGVCKSGSRLTRQLMSLGQVRSGDSEDVDLQVFIQNFRPIIDRVFLAYSEIEIEIDDKPMTIHCDPAQLESALLNLMLNAKDATVATQDRRVSTRVKEYAAISEEVKGLKSGAMYVSISVTDNGAGMSEEVQRRAIEPFYTTKSDSDSGFGLGLTTVNGFVNQCKGVITIDSIVGEYTKVTLFLPQATVVSELNTEGDVSSVVPGNGEKILLVEDREELRMTLARMIAGLSYQVITAGNAQEGLAQFKKNSDIDVALVDVVLPGAMGGVKMIHEVRKTLPNVKVIFMSGFFDEAEQFSRDSDQSFLQKPVSRHRLASELARVLSW